MDDTWTSTVVPAIVRQLLLELRIVLWFQSFGTFQCTDIRVDNRESRLLPVPVPAIRLKPRLRERSNCKVTLKQVCWENR